MIAQAEREKELLGLMDIVHLRKRSLERLFILGRLRAPYWHLRRELRYYRKLWHREQAARAALERRGDSNGTT